MTEPSATPDAAAQEAMRTQWVREQFQKANRFLAEKGIVPSKVIAEECRYLAPLVALWKLESSIPSKKTYWVIGGDLPADFIEVTAAKDAREAMRHFSFRWQMQAEGLLQSSTVDATQEKFAQLLISRAESLYQLQNDDSFWQQN
ncbi:DUF4826 family protein [Shewanella yunxiaonensis]|uniref:DUF4826 family protein n=1 Tax=Shewanella yunxiaonensis TaxID=2829809 RepID=A0ABX7YX36_9GAMM|nr:MULTISPECIES: DUF4826 family protein [Shewanella]MDF0535446.1 DUF4826 family protein [Shewanella sp. A32]QUN07344.1 DUF4826 family protein [Shewanella yunxiaonensis]